VSRVALPDRVDQKYGHDLLPPLLEPGTYAVQSESSGSPWLAADVWMYMAFNDDRRLALAAAGMPGIVHRDDPPPLLPWRPFRPDVGVFLRTLARLRAAREPWLRTIYDHVEDRRYSLPCF
jgi:hypothetical protein